MKKLIRILALFLLCSLLLCCPVMAEEVDPKYDWDNMDWENFNFKELDIWQWRELASWAETNADWPVYFKIFTNMSDGVLEYVSSILRGRFEATPLTFIRELAKEDVGVQLRIIPSLISSPAMVSDDTVPQLILWLNEDDLELQEEKAVLQLMRDNVVKYWGDEIPKTGDPVVFIAAAMVLSGAAAGVLVTKKRSRRV